MAIDTVKQDVRNACDSLDRKLAQLHAMLIMTYGDAQESFESMNDDLRGNYMWACSDLAEQCKALSSSITPIAYQNKAA